MGLLSSSVSLSRYKVDEDLKGSTVETVLTGLRQNAFTEIEDPSMDMIIGWTSFTNPYQPTFEGSSFVMGELMVFSLRIDKKSIPAKLIKKYFELEVAKRLKESGRDFISRNEKKEITDHVKLVLSQRIPLTPNIYDLIWDYENKTILFFTTQKSANEEMESLFFKSFKISPIRLFPFTLADQAFGLADHERDQLTKLSMTPFTE